MCENTRFTSEFGSNSILFSQRLEGTLAIIQFHLIIHTIPEIIMHRLVSIFARNFSRRRSLLVLQLRVRTRAYQLLTNR